MDDGRTIRTMTFNQEGFFHDKVEIYLELCLEKGGKEVKLSTVTTPYVKESPKQSCARRPEKLGEAAAMCKWCRHAFPMRRRGGSIHKWKGNPLPLVRLPATSKLLVGNGPTANCPV